MNEKTVLAIDPGRSKCGMAVVIRRGASVEVLDRDIVAREKLKEKVHEWIRLQNPQLIIVGGGTQSQPIVQEIREHLPSIGILVIDEENTSLHARERYWEHHGRHGWRRLLPSTLQVPPVPVDDFVAVILAERVLLER